MLYNRIRKEKLIFNRRFLYKNKKLFKVISIILVVIMLLHIIPQSVIAFAAEKVTIEEIDVISQEITETEPEIVGEVVSLRDEYTKHFRREDGSFFCL